MEKFLLWLAEKIYKHYGRYEDIRLLKFIKVQDRFYQVHTIEFTYTDATIKAKIPEFKEYYKINPFKVKEN